MNTEVTFLGKSLASPIVLTHALPDAARLRPVVEAGAGAVVVCPLWEEEIIWDIKQHGREVAPVTNYGANLAYVERHMADDYVQRHLDRIADLKAKLTVPVFASINCYSFDAWMQYLTRIESTGCDGIEFDIQLFPFSPAVSHDDVDRFFDDLISTHHRICPLPLSLKVSRHYTDLAGYLQRLSWLNVDNITLFNGTIPMRIDIETLQMSDSNELTTDGDTFLWTAMLKSQLNCSLSDMVSGGDDVVRSLLSGATTAHISHRNGSFDAPLMEQAHTTLCQWMERHHYSRIADFGGLLAQPKKNINTHDLRAYYLQITKEKN